MKFPTERLSWLIVVKLTLQSSSLPRSMFLLAFISETERNLALKDWEKYTVFNDYRKYALFVKDI